MTAKVLTVREVADVLRVSLGTVYALVDAGKLDCLRIGTGRGTIRILEDDLRRYMESCRRATDGPLLKHIRV